MNHAVLDYLIHSTQKGLFLKGNCRLCRAMLQLLKHLRHVEDKNGPTNRTMSTCKHFLAKVQTLPHWYKRDQQHG